MSLKMFSRVYEVLSVASGKVWRTLLLLPLLAVAPLSAQNMALLDKLYDGVSSSCVEMTYSYDSRVSGIDNRGSGTLSVQGAMWRAKGNGVEMYCDSSSVWIVDPVMKEVVIEPAGDEASSGYMTNPALMLTRLHELFKVECSRPSDDGTAVIYTLHPVSGAGMEYAIVEIAKAGAVLRRASLAFPDGTLVKIEVSSMKLTPKVAVKAFRPETVFDAGWIVTDLR